MEPQAINLRLLRLFRLHTTLDLIAELNVCSTLPKGDLLAKREVDLAETIEQRQWESLSGPCDEVRHWFNY